MDFLIMLTGPSDLTRCKQPLLPPVPLRSPLPSVPPAAACLDADAVLRLAPTSTALPHMQCAYTQGGCVSSIPQPHVSGAQPTNYLNPEKCLFIFFLSSWAYCQNEGNNINVHCVPSAEPAWIPCIELFYLLRYICLWKKFYFVKFCSSAPARNIVPDLSLVLSQYNLFNHLIKSI